MTRIWMNHWFSTAYHIINYLKEEADFYVIVSNRNPLSIMKNVSDEWYVEPPLCDEEYVAYCLTFCEEHNIDVFMPRTGMLAISKEKQRFEAIGVKVMVEDFDVMDVLNRKDQAYALFQEKKIGIVPPYEIITTVEQFQEAYERLSQDFEELCFKFVTDEGGKSFRKISKDPIKLTSLFESQGSKMHYESVIEVLRQQPEVPPLMLLPYLPGDEVSVDCLKTSKGIIMIPRVKPAGRVERIQYDQRILSMCEEVYEHLNLQYPCNIQFKYLHDIPYFLEVNTRMSGGVQLSCLAAGINLPSIAVHQLLGIEKPWIAHYEDTYVSHIETPILIKE